MQLGFAEKALLGVSSRSAFLFCLLQSLAYRAAMLPPILRDDWTTIYSYKVNFY